MLVARNWSMGSFLMSYLGRFICTNAASFVNLKNAGICLYITASTDIVPSQVSPVCYHEEAYHTRVLQVLEKANCKHGMQFTFVQKN